MSIHSVDYLRFLTLLGMLIAFSAKASIRLVTTSYVYNESYQLNKESFSSLCGVAIVL